MVYVVEVGYHDFIFDDMEEAMGFAKTAKMKCFDEKIVRINLYTEKEYADMNKKEDE